MLIIITTPTISLFPTNSSNSSHLVPGYLVVLGDSTSISSTFRVQVVQPGTTSTK